MTTTTTRKTTTDVALAFVFVTLAACATPRATSTASAPMGRQVQPRPPNPRITPGRARVVLEPEGANPVVVDVEVVATEALRRRGLMQRRTMPPDAGMLFVFEEPDVQSFWMRDTYLRLDMIFIGADRTVVGLVENAAPLTDDDRAVEAESRYVLEVHGGFAARHGISTGTRVRFEGLPED